MFNNAKIYNIDESYIFKYAARLEQALAAKYKSLVHQKRERYSQGIRPTKKLNKTKTFDERIQEKLLNLFQIDQFSSR